MKKSKNNLLDINNYPLILRVQDVAEILQVHVRTAYKVMDQENFPLNWEKQTG